MRKVLEWALLAVGIVLAVALTAKLLLYDTQAFFGNLHSDYGDPARREPFKPDLLSTTHFLFQWVFAVGMWWLNWFMWRTARKVEGFPKAHLK